MTMTLTRSIALRMLTVQGELDRALQDLAKVLISEHLISPEEFEVLEEKLESGEFILAGIEHDLRKEVVQ